MKKKNFLILTLAIFFILAGFLFFLNSRDSEKIIHPELTTVVEAVYGTGKIKARRAYEVIMGVMLSVKEIYVNEGDYVKAGERLIKFESGTVFSPFAGVVTKVSSEERQTALPQRPLLKMEDPFDRYIEVSLEQDSALRIRAGQSARVTFETLSDKIFEGKVQSIFSREDEFITHVEVENLPFYVLSGMTADVSIEISRRKEAMVLPLEAISNGEIEIKREGKWVKEKIALGVVDGKRVEVLSRQLKLTDEIRVQEEE